MAIRTILTFPDPVLNKVSHPVERFDAELETLVSDMIETMRDSNGIGLAAPQVGDLRRVIVVEVPEEEGKPSLVYVVCNPTITRREGEARIEEGCLSVPGFYVEVDRAADVTVTGGKLDGSPFLLDAQGLLAICFQHEIEHLEGRLIIHYVSPIKRELYRKEVKRWKAGKPSPSDADRPAL